MLISIIALTSCKGNTAFTRSMYGLTTKYNILFNGKEAYNEGLKNLEKDEASADACFDRAIDKCKKAVQTRSITQKPKRKENPSPADKEWQSRGEWNPYIHNAWLLCGKAQFYKRDYIASATTFAHTARRFWWKPLVIAECHIWKARCYAVQGSTFEAEAELNLVVPQKRYSDLKSLNQQPEFQKLTKQLRKEFTIALEEIKLERPIHVKADSAVVMTKEEARLAAVRDELQTYAETIRMQDSLLHLSTLPKDELLRIIDKKIKALKKAEKKAVQEAMAAMGNQDMPQQEAGNQDFQHPIVGAIDNSWYFYNEAVVSAGKVEFQRIWGPRRPEDNWRRKNKTEVAINFDTSDEESLNDDDTKQDIDKQVDANASGNDKSEASKDAIDPHSREYYLAQIPFSEADKANANALIEESMYNMGVIINEKLDDLPLAIQTFEQLEQRYPQSAHRLDMYYAIYLMYMRMNQTDKAEAYRQKLMHSFPASAYAIAVSDPDYIDNLQQMAAQEDSLYIATYNAYIASESQKVHDTYRWVSEHWPLTRLMPKFLFIHALSYVQEGDTESFRESLEQLTATYPSSDVSPLASQMVKGIHEGRNVQKGATTKGMTWNSTLQQEGTEADSMVTFIDNDDIPHLLLLAYKTDSISQNDLLFEIAKFNFENYLVKDFDLEIMTTGDLSILIISKFDNIDALIEYHDRMDHSATLNLPEGIYMIDISETNFRALLKGRTFDEYFQWAKETYGI